MRSACYLLHVLAVAFGVGCGFCWFDAAAWARGFLLSVSTRSPEANSLIWSTELVLEIAAPAGAGLLAALTDPTAVLAVDSDKLCHLGRLTGPDTCQPGQLTVDRGTPRRLRAEIGEGLRYLWRCRSSER
jgi:hypothetical protein